MRLLYLTAGAAEMYCGSCLRDNALAAALLRARARRRARCRSTRRRRPTRRTSARRTCSSAASACFWSSTSRCSGTRRRSSTGCGTRTPVLQARVEAADQSRPGGARRDDGVDAERRRRAISARKSRRCCAGSSTSRAFDAVNLPFTLLIGLAQAAARGAEGARSPARCRARICFSSNLPEPWQTQALDLIRRAVAGRRRLHRGQRVLRRLHVDVPRHSARQDHASCRSASTWTAIAPKAREPTPPYTVGFFGRIAPEKGLHVLADAYRRLRAQAGRAADAAAGRRLHARTSIATYLDGIERRLARVGTGAASSATPARRIARARSRCCRRWT